MGIAPIFTSVFPNPNLYNRSAASVTNTIRFSSAPAASGVGGGSGGGPTPQQFMAQSQIIFNTHRQIALQSQRTATAWRQIERSAEQIGNRVDKLFHRALSTTYSFVKGLAFGGTGGMLGLGFMGASIANSRYAAMGLGTSYGENAAFGVNFSRFGNTNAFANAASRARMVGSSENAAYYALGINPSGTGSTTDLALRYMKEIRRRTQGMSDAQLGYLENGFGTGRAGYDLETLRRYRDMPEDEFNAQISHMAKDKNSLSMNDKAQRAWTDFIAGLERAGELLKSGLGNSLAPIATGLTKLSEALSELVNKFVSSGEFGKAIDSIAAGMKSFGDFISTPAFREDMSKFIMGISAAAKGLWEFVSGPVFKILAPAAAGALIAGPTGAAIGGTVGALNMLDDPNRPIGQPRAGTIMDPNRPVSGDNRPRDWPSINTLVPPGGGFATGAFNKNRIPGIYARNGGGIPMPQMGIPMPGFSMPAIGGFRIPGTASGGLAGLPSTAYNMDPKMVSSDISYFMSQGWTREQAVGIVANIVAESGGDPSIGGDYLNGKPTSFGLWQWHDPARQKGYEQRYGHSIQAANSRAEQLDYINHELKSSFANVGMRLGNDPSYNAALLVREALMPMDKEGEARKRAAIAQQIATGSGGTLGGANGGMTAAGHSIGAPVVIVIEDKTGGKVNISSSNLGVPIVRR